MLIPLNIKQPRRERYVNEMHAHATHTTLRPPCIYFNIIKRRAAFQYVTLSVGNKSACAFVAFFSSSSCDWNTNNININFAFRRVRTVSYWPLRPAEGIRSALEREN
jgi:hypothetical protein